MNYKLFTASNTEYNRWPTLPRAAAILTAALLIIISSSCAQNDISAPHNEGEVMVTFSLSLPDNTSAMRALTGDEDAKIETIEVLAFKGGKYSYTAYSEVVAGLGSAYTAAVDLVVSADDNDKYDLVILANSREIAAGQSFTKDMDKDVVLSLLTTSVSGKWIASNGLANYRYMPMSSDPLTLTGLKITGAMQMPTVNLYRALARISVKLTQKDGVQASDKFQLTSVRVYNHNTKGNLIGGHEGQNYTKEPNAIDSRGSTPLVYGSDTDPQTSEIINSESCENEIFLFEVDQTYLTDDTRPCIVIGGMYDGSSTTTYYRADFCKDTNYLDIFRNHSYAFNVTAINGIGYSTPEEAFAARSMNIEYGIAAVDDALVGGVVTDGHYKLGVSAPTLYFSADARDASSTDNIITVFSDYDGTVKIDEVSIDGWLSITGTSLSGNTITLNSGKAELSLLLDDNTSGVERTATITLTAGRMRYEVVVTQSDERTIKPTIIAYNLPQDCYLGGGTYTFYVYHNIPFDIILPTEHSDKIASITPFYTGTNTTQVTVQTKDLLPSLTSEYFDISLTFISTEQGVTYSQIYTFRAATPTPEEEANSYIVSPNSSDYIYIPVSQAYKAQTAIEGNGGNNADAVLPSEWFTDGGENFGSQLIWKDNKDMTIDHYVIGSGKTAYLKVRATTTDKEGNAVIAITNSEGIRWSWHIWVTDYTPTDGGGGFMDRNLGALYSGTSSGGQADKAKDVFGLWYQWGRKDPFPGASKYDGTEITTLYNSTGGTVSIDTDEAVPEYNNLQNSILNPTRFYTYNGSRFDWYTKGTASTYQNNNLWGGYGNPITKTVYDPCPPGWRVPRSTNTTATAWTSPWEGMTGGSFAHSDAASGLWRESYGGWYPAAGYRLHDATVSLVGSYGNYWSASPYGATDSWAYYLYFDYGGSIYVSSSSRSMSMSVRCVRE